MSSVNAINRRHPSVESNPGCPTIACPVRGSSFSPSGRFTGPIQPQRLMGASN